MISFFKKPLNYILTGSFSVVFAACYGAPVELENPKIISAKNSNGMAIEGLKVQLFENRNPIDELHTDENGSVEFYHIQRDDYLYSVVIEDIDGVENGGDFETKEVDVTEENIIDVVLQEKLIN